MMMPYLCFWFKATKQRGNLSIQAKTLSMCLSGLLEENHDLSHWYSMQQQATFFLSSMMWQ